MMYYSVQRTGGDLETNVAHSCLESLLITRKQWVGVCGWQSSEHTKGLIPIFLPMLKCSFWLDSILEKKLISSNPSDMFDSCTAADSLSKGTIACMIYSCVLDYAFTRS
ncbi:unnamed protein product [Sphagnum troendelagicum]